MVQKFRRINSWSRPAESWFKTSIKSDLLLREPMLHVEYIKFGTWFKTNCVGFWAFPNPKLLLFTSDEDRIKFILKYL